VSWIVKLFSVIVSTHSKEQREKRMARNDQALKVVLAAARQLSPKLQKELAEQLIRTTTPDESTVVVCLQRLSPQKQARLTRLMDKNDEGRLTQAEREELRELGVQVDQLLLANSQTLARAMRPDLFNERGNLRGSRFRRALRESSVTRAESKQGHLQG
jgi:hypothetical protein